MKRIIQINLLISIMFLAIGCKKNQLKKPVDVSVQMDINRENSNEGHLLFTKGYIRIAEFTVEGKRQEGADVELSKEFEQGLIIDFSPTQFVDALHMDIPQGNYTSLDINFDTHEGNDEPTISVKGTFKNSSNEDIPLIFEFMSSEYFSVNGESSGSSALIVLDKSNPALSFIEFDPIYWFDIVSMNMLNNANLYNVDGVQTLLINEEKNEDIYDLIADRIDETTSATFSD
ncbi:MAG: hypothetical protein ABJG68_11995 [Crocinitomicaceae bacterium]